MPNNESITCRYFRELNLTSTTYQWMNIVRSVTKLFRPCSNIDNNTYCLDDTVSLFHCPNTKKCISKHRLVDGINDCGENKNESCTLNDKYRFKCQIDERCIAPTIIDDGAYDCHDLMDESKRLKIDYTTQISFQILCDGFFDLTPLIINGSEETDENDCEHRLCNNSYTRCNGFWNCPNGADEVNCSPSRLCSPLEHLCISLIHYTITYLTINKANDGDVSEFREFLTLQEF